MLEHAFHINSIFTVAVEATSHCQCMCDHALANFLCVCGVLICFMLCSIAIMQGTVNTAAVRIVSIHINIYIYIYVCAHIYICNHICICINFSSLCTSLQWFCIGSDFSITNSLCVCSQRTLIPAGTVLLYCKGDGLFVQDR